MHEKGICPFWPANTYQDINLRYSSGKIVGVYTAIYLAIGEYIYSMSIFCTLGTPTYRSRSCTIIRLLLELQYLIDGWEQKVRSLSMVGSKRFYQSSKNFYFYFLLLFLLFYYLFILYWNHIVTLQKKGSIAVFQKRGYRPQKRGYRIEPRFL